MLFLSKRIRDALTGLKPSAVVNCWSRVSFSINVSGPFPYRIYILLIFLLHLTRLASPLHGPQDLVERDNEWNLKCSNAPTIVAGSYVSQISLHPNKKKQQPILTKRETPPHSLLNASDVTAPLPKVLPKSGSNQPWCKYLWCVPGTRACIINVAS